MAYLGRGHILITWGFPGGLAVKNLPTMQETWVWSLGCEDLLEKEMATLSSFLPWEVHGQRSLVSYSPWGHKESDMTEHTCIHRHMHRSTEIHRHTQIQTHTHRYTETHTHVHACTHTDTHSHRHTHTDIHVHTHTCMHVHTQTRTHRDIHTHVHACTHRGTHARARTHTHTHTHTHTLIPYTPQQTCLLSPGELLAWSGCRGWGDRPVRGRLCLWATTWRWVFFVCPGRLKGSGSWGFPACILTIRLALWNFKGSLCVGLTQPSGRPGPAGCPCDHVCLL